jgi:hypothetical protein
MDRVHDEGLDPNEVSRRGLLTLIPARDAYLKNQTFTPELAERSVAKLTPAKTIALGDDLDPPAVHCSRFGRTAQRRGRSLLDEDADEFPVRSRQASGTAYAKFHNASRVPAQKASGPREALPSPPRRSHGGKKARET